MTHKSRKAAPIAGKPPFGVGLNVDSERISEVAAAHAAAVRVSAAAGRLLVLRLLGDQRLGGEHEARDRCGVLQSRAHDLDGVDDAGSDEVFVLAGRGVETEVAGSFFDLLHDDRAFFASVGDDLAEGLFHRAADDLHAGFLLGFDLEAVERLLGADESDAAAGDDAFLDRRAGGVESVFDARLLLFHLDLGRSADLDHGNAADQLGETLLELLTVVVAAGVVDLGADLGLAALDLVFAARAVDEGGVVLVDLDALDLAEIRDGHVLELEAELLRDDLAAREDRAVLEHFLAAITE